MKSHLTFSFILILLFCCTSLTLEAQFWNGPFPSNPTAPIYRSGEVGIGLTTFPSTTLEVQGSGVWFDILDFRSGTGNFTSGTYNSALGSWNNINSGNACSTIGEDNSISGANAGVAIGSGHTINGGLGSVSIGYSNNVNGSSIAIGSALETMNGQNIIIGNGGLCSPFTNNISNSLMVGFDSNIPTLFVGPSSGCSTTGNVGIGTSTPAQKLHVAGTIRSDDLASTLGGSVCATPAGDLYISGACGGGPDNLGNHTATMPLNMACNEILDASDIIFCNGNALVTTASGEIYTNGSFAVGGPLFPLPIGVPAMPYMFGVHGNAYIDGSLWVSSDKRYKKEITPVSNGLEMIKQLNGVSYSFDRENYPEKRFAPGKTYGFIAQELEKVIPEAVVQDLDGYYRVNYDAIIPILAEAIEEQQNIIEEKEERLNDLENRLARLEEMLLNGQPNIPNTKFKLQNHPNPFSHSTTIRYELPEGTRAARLEIYNLNGAKMMEENLDANASTITITSKNLTSGTYLYTIVANGLRIASKKMILQR